MFQTAKPVNVSRAALANEFRLAHYDISNRDDGPVLDVWWNSLHRKKSGEEGKPDEIAIVANHGPEQFDGKDLSDLSEAAYRRATHLIEHDHMEIGAAYALGQHDAILAALQSRELIPKK